MTPGVDGGLRKTYAVAEWLGLTPQEQAIVNMRVNFVLEVERVRKASNIAQQELADKIGTRQSGVARMLNNPTTAMIDSLISTLLALGLRHTLLDPVTHVPAYQTRPALRR